MSKHDSFLTGRLRLLIFAAAAVLHITLILGVAFRMENAPESEEPVAGVMKLVDVEEETPPPPPEQPPEAPQTSTEEAVAETMIETEEEPPPYTVPVPSPPETERIDYLPQHRISVLPVLPEDEISRVMVYPPIAQRSNIEGTVYLELFIDRQGNVRQARVLRENPPGRGFGEAAVSAFRGIKGKPAEANGQAVAVRFRYNISFTLR